MNNSNDYELLDLIKENNEDALNTLYNKYDILIWQIIKEFEIYIKLFKVDKEDLYCIALINFNYAISKFNDNNNCSFKTYLIIIIKRAFRNYILGKNKSRIKDDYILDLGEAFEIEDITYEPSTIIDKDEYINELISNKVLSKLEIKIVRLLIDGYRYDDIVKVLNIEKKQIYNAVNRIKIKILANKNT